MLHRLLQRCRRRWGVTAIAGVALALLAGCRQVGYYGQAAHGHLRILSRQQPITELLADPQTPEKLRPQLRLVLELREFATRELALPAGKHYRHYADLRRDSVVWNVYAAPEFSLKARSWWYPVVGRQTYRGYFAESGARQEAARLAADGFDTHVGGVDAYSTLGWFSDPVLNTFVHRDEAALAGLLFHELAHQQLYFSGDTAFNEAFATAIEQDGVRRWLTRRGDDRALAAWELKQRRREQFNALVKATRKRLEQVYQHDAADAGAVRTAKAAVIESFRQQLAGLQTGWGAKLYQTWLTQPVNNARLNTVSTYHDLVPGFAALLRAQGGDIAKFIAEVRKLKPLSKEQRREHLREAAEQAARGSVESPVESR